MMNLDRYPNDTEGRISALCTAMIHEAVELQRTTNWKWWKKTYGVQSSGSQGRVGRHLAFSDSGVIRARSNSR